MRRPPPRRTPPFPSALLLCCSDWARGFWKGSFYRADDGRTCPACPACPRWDTEGSGAVTPLIHSSFSFWPLFTPNLIHCDYNRRAIKKWYIQHSWVDRCRKTLIKHVFALFRLFFLYLQRCSVGTSSVWPLNDWLRSCWFLTNVWKHFEKWFHFWDTEQTSIVENQISVPHALIRPDTPCKNKNYWRTQRPSRY